MIPVEYAWVGLCPPRRRRSVPVLPALLERCPSSTRSRIGEARSPLTHPASAQTTAGLAQAPPMLPFAPRSDSLRAQIACPPPLQPVQIRLLVEHCASDLKCGGVRAGERGGECRGRHVRGDRLGDGLGELLCLLSVGGAWNANRNAHGDAVHLRVDQTRPVRRLQFGQIAEGSDLYWRVRRQQSTGKRCVAERQRADPCDKLYSVASIGSR